MTRLPMRVLMMAAAVFGTAPTVQAAERTVEQISECMRANVPFTLQIKDIAIVSVDKTGSERTMSGRLYATREDSLVRVMWRLEGPADMRGAAYLVREAKESSKDEMYIYIPALNKVRRITGGSQDNPLFGTDISYSDVKQINHAFTGGKVALEPAAALEGRPVYVMSMVPDASQQSRYEKIRTWVDQKTCVAVKAEFFEAGAVVKRFTASAKNLKQSGALWYLSEAQVEDLREKTHSRLMITGVTGGKDLSDRYFNSRTFYIGG